MPSLLVCIALGQIRLLAGRALGNRDGNRSTSIPADDIRHALTDAANRFIKRHLDQRPIFPQQRHFQPTLFLRRAKAKTPTGAKHAALPHRQSARHHIAARTQVDRAAHGAEGTSGQRGFFPHRHTLLNWLKLPQRARRANRHTLAAGDTVRLFELPAKFRRDHRIKAAADKAQSRPPHCLVAHAHTQAAEDAFIGVSLDKRMRLLLWTVCFSPSKRAGATSYSFA